MNFVKVFIILITTTTVIRAQQTVATIGDSDTSAEDLETIVTTALFKKLNWIVTEIQQINRNVEQINKRLTNQENLLRTSTRNQRRFEADFKTATQTQTLNIKKLMLEIQTDLYKRLENFPQQYVPPTSAYANHSDLKAKGISNSSSYDLVNLKQHGNWTVILRRQDGSENFNRPWSEYRQGFGNLSGEFFVGLEKLYASTALELNHQELLVVLKDFENQTRYAYYEEFAVADEKQKYKITKLGKYHGDAGDALRSHVNAMFSTNDQDNDSWDLNCAEMFKGGWWFVKCFNCHLSGSYINHTSSSKEANERGIIWKTFHGPDYSLKFVEMMIRPKVL